MDEDGVGIIMDGRGRGSGGGGKGGNGSNMEIGESVSISEISSFFVRGFLVRGFLAGFFSATSMNDVSSNFANSSDPHAQQLSISPEVISSVPHVMHLYLYFVFSICLKPGLTIFRLYHRFSRLFNLYGRSRFNCLCRFMRHAVFFKTHDVDGRAKAVYVYFVGGQLAEMRNRRNRGGIVAVLSF